MSSIYTKRLKKLFKKIGNKVDALFIIADNQLLRCLTGCPEGSAIAKPDSIEFIVHIMFSEAAERTGFPVHTYFNQLEKKKLIEDVLGSVRRIGFRASAVPHQLYTQLKKELSGKTLVDISKGIAEAFEQKDDAEIANLRKACRITARAAKNVPNLLREGITEIELMREINYSMEEIGSGMVSFGKNTSLPHHLPGKTRLRKGDFVMVDFGCSIDGCGADLTRTFLFGKASNKQKQIYSEVYRAMELAFELVLEGKNVRQINKAVSKMFEKDGYGKFIHSVGHALGYLGGAFVNKINCVNTIEPGIYIPGFGGVRIEDDILITKSGFDNLTKIAPKRKLIEV